MTEAATTYRLVRPSLTGEPPVLDEQQQRVADHDGGPLLVLAGPGTGKTTTLVEAIVRRIDEGTHPDRILALTFSRKAAEQLRDRVTARVGRTMSASIGSTFHSFAYGLIRRYAPAELYVGPLRLLSAPEQDVVLRELLQDHPESIRWPDELRHALGTRGFAREVHAVLSRAREKGLDGEELQRLGEANGLPEFVAAGAFLEQYLTVLDGRGAVDYSDLIRRATIEATVHRDELRAAYAHVFVDEYQDTDTGQVALLRAIAGDGRDLVVVGDPHQSIYAFRGAEVRGVLDFPTDFPRADGSPAEVVALGTTRRFGPRLLTAAQRLAGRIGLPGSIPESAREAFLAPTAEAGEHGEGRVTVRTFDSDRAEAEHLADLLRRAHLEDGIAWDEMAVLVRSGRQSIPPLRRSLGAAGVPVEVASDEVPLVRDPAALPLIDALRVVLNLDNDDPDHVDHIDAARAEALLTGPLGGLDAGDVRRLARQLRQREKESAHAEQRLPVHSRELVRRAVVDVATLDGLTGPEVQRATSVGDLVRTTRAQLDEGATAEELLWALWSGTSWPRRLRHRVELGGGGARRAHRDLDSICALFDAAARAEETRDHVGVREFLATLVAQQIPADTLAERGARGAAVRLLTAHRAKGLEWRLVVVAHVQQDGWPDLRRRSSILGADRIGADGLVPPTSLRATLVEERRLFYVACTRAREQLVVTAVASRDDDGDQPSRFLDELGVTVEAVEGRPARTLSLAGVVAELRRNVADPEVSPALRAAAARRLARLASESTARSSAGADGRPLDVVGHPVGQPVGPAGARPRPAGAGVVEHRRALRRVPDPVVPRPRGRRRGPAAPVGQRRRDGARAGPAGRRRRARSRSRRCRPADGPRRAGLGPPGVPDAVGQGPRARADPVRPGPLPRLAPRQHPHAGGDRGALPRGPGAAERGAGVARGLRRPPRARRRRPGGGRGPQDRSHQAVRQVGADQRPARALPAGRRPRGRRRARSTRRPGPGGAELVQLGLTGDDEQATVQQQPGQADDGPERAALRGRLTRAAELLRTENFPAVAGQHCRDCDFVPICPIKSAGHVIGPVTAS